MLAFGGLLGHEVAVQQSYVQYTKFQNKSYVLVQTMYYRKSQLTNPAAFMVSHKRVAASGRLGSSTRRLLTSGAWLK